MTVGLAARVLASIENATDEIAADTWQDPIKRPFRSESHAPST
jgi:hypothetical protein